MLAAVVQLTTSKDSETSLGAACDLVRAAAARGAKLIVLPENVTFMGADEEKRSRAEPLTGPSFRAMSELSREHNIWLLAGTLVEQGPSPEKTCNTSVLFNPAGETSAVYRKIHLFDIALGDSETYKESDSVEPGTHAVLAKTPWGRTRHERLL